MHNSLTPPEAANTSPASDLGTSLSAIDPRKEGNSVLAPAANPQFSSPPYLTQEPEGFDIHRLLTVVLRRWPIMLLVLLAAIGLGLATITLSKPIYQATATVELNTSQRGGSSSEVPGLEAFLSGDQSRSLDTQIETLRSGSLQNRALQTLSPKDKQALRELAPVGVSPVGNTNLIAVGVQSYDSQAAAALATAICKEYISLSLEKNRSNTRGAVTYVEDQLRSVRQRLAEAQGTLKEFKQKTGIFSISEEATALGSKVAGLQQEVEAADSDRASALAKLKGIQGLLSQIPQNKVVAVGIARNPAVTELQGKLSQLELERSIALKEYMPTSYRVVTIDSQIKAIRDRMRGEAQTIVSGWQPDPKRAPLAGEAAAVQTQLWAADAKISALREQTTQARQSLKQLPEQEFRYTQLATDVQVLQQTYQMLNERLQNLRIGEEARVADARLVFVAEPPSSPVAPNKKRLMIYATVLGLLGAIGMALLLDMLDNRIYSDEEAQRVTGLPVLTHVPLLRDKQEMSLMSMGEQKGAKTSALLESFRMLRANIAFSAVDKPIRGLVVTSSVPNEGKSHSALNLAIAAATSGERVILVDLDLRRPTVHSLCNLPNQRGFSSVASNRCTIEEALQPTPVPGLRVLTAGPMPPNPFKLINSQTARSIVENLSQYADFIVIDTPPMLGMADARVIASWVDATLLVVSCQEVSRREVGKATDLLLQGGTDVVGTILTKVPGGSEGYYGYNYYGYRAYGTYLQAGEEPDSPSLGNPIPDQRALRGE